MRGIGDQQVKEDREAAKSRESAALKERIAIIETEINHAKKMINPSNSLAFEAALKRADCSLQSLQRQLVELHDQQ